MGAAPGTLVSEKLAGFATPDTDAVTLYGPPAVAFAVNGAAATPDAFVATTIVAVLLLNTPDAPDPGAVNVTFTPLTGLLPASFTATALAKAVLIVADCGVVPAFAVIVVAAPAVFVSEKFAGVSPVAAAATVYGPPAVAFTVTASALAKAVLIVADCGVVPAFAVIVVAVPVVFVSEKFAVVRPVEAAVTV